MDSLYDFPTFQLLKSKGTLNIPYNKPVSPHQLFTNDATNNLKIKYLYSVFLLEYIYFPCLNFTFTLCETNTSKRFFYIYIVSLLRSSQYKFQELHRIIIWIACLNYNPSSKEFPKLWKSVLPFSISTKSPNCNFNYIMK